MSTSYLFLIPAVLAFAVLLYYDQFDLKTYLMKTEKNKESLKAGMIANCLVSVGFILFCLTIFLSRRS